jgi:hypothetical protein
MTFSGTSKLYLTEAFGRTVAMLPLTREASDALEVLGLGNGDELAVTLTRRRYQTEAKLVGTLASITVDGKARMQVRLRPEGTAALLDRGFEDLEEIDVTIVPFGKAGSIFLKGDE